MGGGREGGEGCWGGKEDVFSGTSSCLLLKGEHSLKGPHSYLLGSLPPFLCNEISKRDGEPSTPPALSGPNEDKAPHPDKHHRTALLKKRSEIPRGPSNTRTHSTDVYSSCTSDLEL